MKSEDPAPHPLDPFVSRIDRCVYEKAEGTIAQTKSNPKGIEKRWYKHLTGESRLGVFLVLPGDVCRAGVVDLDSHNGTAPTRYSDAVEIVELLDRKGIRAYWVPSRRGRGAHVWIFFDAPGVPADDLRPFLNELAAPYQAGVDVRPDRSRYGGPIFLPYFGGVVNMLDIDVKAIPRDKLDANNPSVVPACAPTPRGSTWVPRYKLGRRRSGNICTAFHEILQEGEARGLVFFKGGSPQAREGWRNKIAGFIAGGILNQGGRFEEFVAWDTRNEPPLATDEPEQIDCWWRWATRRCQHANMRSPAAHSGTNS